MSWTNWSGCQSNQNSEYLEPKDLDALQQLVLSAKSSGKAIAVVGAGHSFNNLFDADLLISLKYFDSLISVDEQAQALTVGAGMRLADFYSALEKQNWSLPTFPTGYESTIGGIVSTATHGCGANHPILAERMIACKILKADGELVTVNANDEAMPAIRAGLGSLGVVLEVTMQCEPAFLLRKHVLIEPLADVFEQYAERDQEYDSQQIAWFVGCEEAAVIVTNRVEAGDVDLAFENNSDREFEAALHLKTPWTLRFPQMTRKINRKLMAMIKPSEQILKAPRAYANYPEHKLVNSEWGVATDRVLDVVTDIQEREKGGQAFQGFIEIRSVASDNNYLSHCYQRDTVTFGNTIFGDFSTPPKALRKYSEVMQAHEARPHWAKACTVNRKLQSLFPALPQFKKLQKEWDPEGIFSLGL